MTQHRSPCQSITSLKWVLGIIIVVGAGALGVGFARAEAAMNKVHALEVKQARDTQKLDYVIEKLSDIHQEIKERYER